jgi:S1-C subfamily serine protease
MKISIKTLTLAAALATTTPATAVQYETIDYYVQQMIVHAIANDAASVQTFREQLENQRRTEPPGDASQTQSSSQQGQDHLARGHLKQALAAFRQAFIADPTDPGIAGQLALTYLRLDRLKEAERLAVYTLYLASDRTTAWLTLGQTYGRTGDVQRASGAFANAYRFAQDRPQLVEQLRQLATTDSVDAVRIGALQALQSIQPTPAPPDAPKPPTARTNADPPAVASQPQRIDQENPRQQIYRRSIPLTCLIVTSRDGKMADLGSGLLVSPDGLVITNAHVIEKAGNLAVRCGDQESVAQIRRRSNKPDLALLETSLKSRTSFVLNETYNQDLIGLDVFVIGNPYGLEGTFSDGIISGLREIDGVRYIQISAPISPGNSGGPVILGDGTVIGIATMGAKVGQNINFAIAATEVIASGFFDPTRMKSQTLKGKGQ